jgi:hypothetical protein
MSAFNKFNCFVSDLGNKIHNLGSDALKVMLTNVAPVATNAVLTDLTEISAGNGYTAGGTTKGSNTYSQTSGLAKLIAGANVVFTATGAVGPFRYAALYNSTASGKNLIGWWDFGSSITLASADTFTVSFDATNGVLSLT